MNHGPLKSRRALQPRARRNSRRGVALLLVLWLVALLAMVSLAASTAARSSGDLVAARRANATAQSMAESGVTVALSTIGDSLRATLNDSTRRDLFLNALDAGVNEGRSALGTAASDTLGDGAFVVAVVDVSARLDINEAGADGLARLLSQFMPAAEAQTLAERVAARVRGDGTLPDSALMASEARDSVARVLLGRSSSSTRLRHPFETLEELEAVPGFAEKVLTQVLPLLTVDGDARINRRAAPPSVLRAASGTLVDAPTRLLIVARGWQLGHPLSHEIQAVYDVSNNSLQLVRWRERVL
jgi:general secretion pathway protein K